MTMRLLDLFCGAGGAGMGYHRAGYEVVGVDNRPQKHYPFEFHEADAFDYIRDHGHEFDVIHASPPCQAFSSMKSMYNAKKHEDLLTPVRELLIKIGKTYVIENVPGAPMINPIMLCGTMFGLQTSDGLAELRRHRLFESSVSFDLRPPCQHNALVIGVYGGHGRDRRRSVSVLSKCGKSLRDGTQQYSTEERKHAMGIGWMTGDELSQAIPPAYTFWIGKQLMKVLK